MDEKQHQTYIQEFTYRHKHFWTLFYRLAFAVLFVLSVPFIHPDKIHLVKHYIFFFPYAGMFLSLFGGWMLGAEYLRIKNTYKRYEHTGMELGSVYKAKFLENIFRPSIGWTVTITYFVGFFCLSYFAFSALQSISR